MKNAKKINDCKECPYFHWDFEVGRFLCEKAREQQVEDLHLIPDWCPISDTLWMAASANCLDAESY